MIECTREFKGPCYTVKAHPRSCFFCEHLTDIFYDTINGPYMFICDIHYMEQMDDPDVVGDQGLKGTCPDFVEETEEP